MAKTYEQLVEEGREVIRERDGANWKAGDLALEVESLSAADAGATAGDPDHEASPLKRYADALEVNYTTLVSWRSTADAWPKVRRRRGVSWAAHRVLNAQQDRFQLITEIQSKAEARKIVRDRDKRDDKPDILPATFSDRLIYALGRMNGETTPFENLIRSNDGRKLQARHLETIQRSAAIARATADLLEAVGRGDYEAINAQEWMDVLYRPWREGEIKS